jgi:hypothetical protein
MARLIGGVAAIVILRALYPDITRDEAAGVMLSQEGSG